MNRKSVAIFVVGVSLFVGCGTFRKAPLVPNDDRSLVFEARADKDESRLLDLASHPDLNVRNTAWRALANITVQNTDSLMAMALRNGSDVALFSLTMQPLTSAQLRRLESEYETRSELRAPIARILGIAGDSTTAVALFKSLDEGLGRPWEAELALAVNRRWMVNGVPPGGAEYILSRSPWVEDPIVHRAWLYGMFRSNASWLDSTQAQALYSDFASRYDAMDPFIRQMMVNILGKARHPELPAFMRTRITPQMSHIEQTELARSMFRYPTPDASVLVALLELSLDEENIPLALDILNTAHTSPSAAVVAPIFVEQVRRRVRVAEPIEYAVMRLQGVKPSVIPENPALTGEYLALMGDTDEAIEAMKANPNKIRAYLSQLRRPESMVPEVTDSTLIVPPVDIVHQTPIWILETSEGRIVIELDGLRTPASVHAISTIAEEGYYTGTFFHRVIQNFVIQAGLSFSGDRREPDFTGPTEGVETQFERGSVGVASAGRDTEGGQFFIMHQWMPHLNGRYSNIGRVVEGMDVVDRVWQGTLIHSSRIVLP
jgi:cyclophilin family peptidyl-prolyl cis-trans isomerase